MSSLEEKIISEPVELNEDNQTFDLEETYKQMSPLRLVLRRFFRSKLSMVGLITL